MHKNTKTHTSITRYRYSHSLRRSNLGFNGNFTKTSDTNDTPPDFVDTRRSSGVLGAFLTPSNGYNTQHTKFLELWPNWERREGLKFLPNCSVGFEALDARNPLTGTEFWSELRAKSYKGWKGWGLGFFLSSLSSLSLSRWLEWREWAAALLF